MAAAAARYQADHQEDHDKQREPDRAASPLTQAGGAPCWACRGDTPFMRIGGGTSNMATAFLMSRISAAPARTTNTGVEHRARH